MQASLAVVSGIAGLIRWLQSGAALFIVAGTHD
jgi:hypothetical protein